MSMAFFSWNPKALSQSHLAWCSHPLTVQWEWDGGCLSGNTVSMWCPLVIGRCIHSSPFRFFFCRSDACPVFYLRSGVVFRWVGPTMKRFLSPRTGSSCGVFLPFDVILEVISSFPSPGSHLTAPSPPSPSPSKVLAAWRIVWTCIDPMWDYSWVIGELDWATSHQGRLTTRCLLGCHFGAGSHCRLCGLSPPCRSHLPLLNNALFVVFDRVTLRLI